MSYRPTTFFVLLACSVVRGAAQNAAAPTQPAAPGTQAATPASQTAAPATQTAVTAKDSVTVTADRGLVNVQDSAATVTVLTGKQLIEPPGLTLDDDLHQVAGFQLFRRTSSWTANPTSQGVSLRGLGSTAASRTLVVSDQVPFNDPFGGWVHWNEIPQPAVHEVNLLRGGAADLYGSSAIGGVIDVVPETPPPSPAYALRGDTSGATEDTALADLLVSASRRSMGLLAAGSTLVTQGYIPTAPAIRGLVDVPANVNDRVGRLELRTGAPDGSRSAFLRGNVLSESRANGTPLQTDGTNLWRYAGGGNLTRGEGTAALRLFGSREAYRQSFSAIAADRNSEQLTKIQHVPTDELGLSLQVSRPIARQLTAALGFDLRDLRSTDRETGVANGAFVPANSTSARQRATGGFADAIWQPGRWSLSASVRADSFRTLDAHTVTGATQRNAALPELDELFASPRVGVARTLRHGFTLTGSAFRAFRGPTLNELYRNSQVGQQTTLANSSLLAERATGFEFGGLLSGRAGRLRGSYFWTEVNRPIAAIALAQTATTQTFERENLGQIRSRGISVEAQSATWRGIDANFGYQLAIATVTQFVPPTPVQPSLTGLWIPEVPREAVNANLNASVPRTGLFHLFATYNGREYDDSANQFLLHSFTRVDVSVERPVSRHLSLTAGAQNMFNRQIEAGRTPTLTLASPRLVQAGLRFDSGGPSQ